MFFLLDRINIEYLIAALILTLAFAAMLPYAVWAGRRGWLRSMKSLRVENRLTRDELLAHIKAIAQDKTGMARLEPTASACGRLRDAYRIVGGYAAAQQLTPAGQLFCDNARILEESAMSVNEAERYTPALPTAHNEIRLEEFARQLVMRTDARIDPELLKAAAHSYNSVHQFTEDELSAMPLVMRRALVMLAAKTAGQCVEDEKSRSSAPYWIERLKRRFLNRSVRPLRPFRKVPMKFKRAANGALIERMLSEYLEREDADGLRWMDEYLSSSGGDAMSAISREHTRQARERDIMGNAITSIKLIGALDWNRASEELSAAHNLMLQDPAGIYPKMDYPSRYMYRRFIAQYAARTGQSESLIAARALGLAAERAEGTEPDGITSHVGYYLIDEGRPALWKLLGRGTAQDRVAFRLFRHSTGIFLATLALADAAVLYGLYLLHTPLWAMAAALPLIGEASRAIIHAAALRATRPKVLPRIAPEHIEGRTLVVVPALLTDSKNALDMARHLSVLRFANPQEKLEYMLLADFSDAKTPTVPEDAELMEVAAEAVEALNQVWGGGYYYIQRGRTFDKGMNRYIGADRKRGALESLNGFLVEGASDCAVAYASVDPASLVGRYNAVITLDADTQLPPDTALTLAGALAHPLVRPCLHNGKRRGHAVLQPRMDNSARMIKTRLQRLFGGEGGVDMYVSAASDFYQNIAGSGTFCGKGVYDPAAFHAAVKGKIRRGTILSHDLLESGLASGAMLCDIPLYDGQPSSVSGWYKRLHRWTRGDWQLLPWLLPTIRTESGRMRNPLGLLSRFKVYDNMRRSAAPIFEMGLIIAGLALNSVPALLVAFIAPRVHFLLNPSVDAFKTLLLRIVLLPMEAMVQFDAIARTLFRVLISRKKMLEWVTAAQGDSKGGSKRGKENAERKAPYVRDILAGLAVIGASVYANPWTLVLSVPLASAWVASRAVENWLGGNAYSDEKLSDAQRDTLMELAEETWGYFADSVDIDKAHPSDNAGRLPPDNVQTDPHKGAARRTSPTNIGMYMLSCEAARSLGLISGDDFITRIRLVVEAVEALDTWHGHLLNWYDTRSLAPLRPMYVSSVDSGNFALAAIVTAQAVRAVEAAQDTRGLDLSNPQNLPNRLDALVDRIEFDKLYDEEASLFYIGMDIENGSSGASRYDLLASESRLLSFLATMRRDAPLKHWRSLSRTMTLAGRRGVLLSWAGTSFEYLMPSILLPTIRGTLLGDSVINSIIAQMTHMAKTSPERPWGISESGYYAFDPELNYQYKAFGLPSLSLRGGNNPHVISPYASALALNAPPLATRAAENIARMRDMGWHDGHGLYEACDYDASRIPSGQPYSLIKSHMSHHQGMILCSIANALTGMGMVNLLMSLPQAEAYAVLLEEKTPIRQMLRPAVVPRSVLKSAYTQSMAREVSPYSLPIATHLLQGMGTTLMWDARDNGYIAHNGYMLTRWRPDPTQMENGPRMYIKLNNGEPTRLGFDPNAAPGTAPAYAAFDSGKVTATVRLGEGGDALEAVINRGVSALDGAVLFEVTLSSKSETEQSVELTSFCEVALSPQKADVAHPAFRNLFIETARPAPRLIIAKRRPRGASDDAAPMFAHWIGYDAPADIYAETDRSGFLKRDGSLAFLNAYENGKVGAVVDPCLSLRVCFAIPAMSERTVLFGYAAVRTEAEAEAIAQKYVTPGDSSRFFRLSSTQAEVSAAFLGLDRAGILAAQSLSTYLLYHGQPAGRQRYVDKNTYGTQGLWAMGISGDLPVISTVFTSLNHVKLAFSMLRIQDYLRRAGLWFDLVFIADEDGGYSQPIRDALREAVAGSPARDRFGQPSGVFIIEKRGLADESQYNLLLAFASFIFYGAEGSVASQLAKFKPMREDADRTPRPGDSSDRFGKSTRGRVNNKDNEANNKRRAGKHGRHTSRFSAAAEPLAALSRENVNVDIYDNPRMKPQTVFGGNDYGGYDADDSYILQPGMVPPAPWCNVITNPHVGAVWTDRGASFMWAGNSGLGRMTAFSNDCLRGSNNEAIFIRDELTRAYCTPTPYPRGGSVKVRHSQGYSVYESNQLGLMIKMTVFADIESAAICRWLHIKNPGSAARKLSVTPFTLWSYQNETEARLLQKGVSGSTVWARHPTSGRVLYQTMFANGVSNKSDTTFGNGISIKSATTDAIAFLGLNGIENPRAMERPELDDMGGELPCAAMMGVIEIAPFAEASVCILTGAAEE